MPEITVERNVDLIARIDGREIPIFIVESQNSRSLIHIDLIHDRVRITPDVSFQKLNVALSLRTPAPFRLVHLPLVPVTHPI